MPEPWEHYSIQGLTALYSRHPTSIKEMQLLNQGWNHQPLDQNGCSYTHRHFFGLQDKYQNHISGSHDDSISWLVSMYYKTWVSKVKIFLIMSASPSVLLDFSCSVWHWMNCYPWFPILFLAELEQFLPIQTGGSHPNPQSQTFCPKLFSHRGEEEIALLQDRYKGKDIKICKFVVLPG